MPLIFSSYIYMAPLFPYVILCDLDKIRRFLVMSYLSRVVIILFSASLSMSGCVKERPRTSDLEGPYIQVAFTGGANYTIDSTESRTSPSDRCVTVLGDINGRNVDVQVIIGDPSGLTRVDIVTEGNGIRPDSIRLGTTVPDIMIHSVDTDFRDEINVSFAPLGANVRTGGIVYFNIESTFLREVTLTVFARDSFGNTTNLERFKLVSDRGGRCANS